MANPTLLKTPIASGGDKNTIPETTGSTTGLLSQEKGWQQINSLPINAGGIAPSRLDFNGVFNLLSNILFYAQKGWQWEFDETQNYFAGCTVKDTVDGKTYVCIADVSASTTHPSADTTHWKLSDLATKDDLANYLPLAGGVMTGTTIRRDSNTSNLNLIGGTSQANGAFLQMYGSDASAYTGRFLLQAGGGDAKARLTGTPEGNLYWGTANVLTSNGIEISSTSISRKVNNDELIISGAGPYLQLYGKNHSNYAGQIKLLASDETNYSYLRLLPNKTLYYEGSDYQYDLGGSAIGAKSLGTTGYCKRADGLIEQWGQTTAPATVSDNVPVTFPITFPNAVSSVVITSEGNLTEGNSPMSYTQVIDVTASGFKYRSFFNSPGEIKKYWRAIGY